MDNKTLLYAQQNSAYAFQLDFPKFLKSLLSLSISLTHVLSLQAVQTGFILKGMYRVIYIARVITSRQPFAEIVQDVEISFIKW